MGYSGGQKFNLTVTGQDAITGETVFSKTTTDFIFELKSFSILIQTDKAIYQPGQLSKIFINLDSFNKEILLLVWHKDLCMV